jgi:hypothetical protein
MHLCLCNRSTRLHKYFSPDANIIMVLHEILSKFMLVKSDNSWICQQQSSVIIFKQNSSNSVSSNLNFCFFNMEYYN